MLTVLSFSPICVSPYHLNLLIFYPWTDICPNPHHISAADSCLISDFEPLSAEMANEDEFDPIPVLVSKNSQGEIYFHFFERVSYQFASYTHFIDKKLVNYLYMRTV